MLKKEEIEYLEDDYLNRIEFMLTQDLEKMLKGLSSKDKIREDWIEIYHRSDKKRQNSDFARGAERIYYWLFNQFGIPNSSPIGADMFFETHNAFVHIDVKTAKINNRSDYKGKVPLGANQTSYKLDGTNFDVNLPIKYSFENKTCLTYIINIIYDITKENIEIKAIIIISVPNGGLSSVYGKKIINAGKSGITGKGFRYAFSKGSRFQLLKKQPSRVRIIYPTDKSNEEIKKMIGLSK